MDTAENPQEPEVNDLAPDAEAAEVTEEDDGTMTPEDISPRRPVEYPPGTTSTTDQTLIYGTTTA